MGRQPRQRPVSCHFCRCQSQDPPRLTATATAPVSRPIAKRGDPPPTDREAEILSRLEKLEALLAQRTNQTGGNPSAASTASSSVCGSDDVPRTRMQTRPSEPSHALPANVQNLTADALWLERTCLGPKPSDSVLVDQVIFRICPIRSIAQPSSYLFQNSSVPSGLLSLEPTRCIWLPQRHETKILIHKYTSVVTYMHHIIHNPSVYKLVDEVYDTIERGGEPQLCQVFLMLVLCTNVTYGWTATDNDITPLFSDFPEANNQSFGWLKAAFDVFDTAQRRSEMGLELAQGLIIVSFVLLNVEGISPRARNCLFQAITICRELGIHRLDHPHQQPSTPITQYSNLKAEIARRVWWYLFITDTMMARFPGPHEGTCIINPKHMNVRKPLNANDEDLVEGREMIGRPSTESTSMSYFLQRMKLGEVLRHFTERVPLSSPDQHDDPYDIVLEIDAAIERFINELPHFLKLNAREIQQLPPGDIQRQPGIVVQRHVMKTFVYGQRCKLHLPYLARGTVEPAYAQSRRACLESARMIIQAEQQMEDEDTTFRMTRLRLCLALHSVFIASIVLLLDFCLGVDADEKDQRRQDLAEAWNILETAKEHSRPTARIQDLLRQVMKKHKVSLPVCKPKEKRPPKPVGENLPPTPTSSTTMMSTGTTPGDVRVSSQELNDLGLNMYLDGMDWESLLCGLEAPMF
ncbi:zinc finger transcription factor yrr1 [Fusarium sporotrichioides]|uniref:Zinc finger transcription factor yrr1 n=1 Tax=Fusarium sporotrichioides TaxID=5514 RepID=A0A395S737_FUSSP|nr:zinc finger transcription factor yrr1 [Fusarium sporotrichioides]